MNSSLLSLAIVLLGVVVTLSAPLGKHFGGFRRRYERRDEQQAYLKRYGYWHGLKSNGNGTDDDYRKSLRSLQRFAGLPDTGEADDDTMELMSTPRCGIPDDDAKDRRRRFVKFGTKWPRLSLSYYIQNQTPDLPSGATNSIMAKASKLWSEVSPLTFAESQKSTADITIRFASGSHGDGAAFDGPGGVLAHAFYPTAGAIHFDEDETWTQGTISGTNLFQVATHEFGHALGLAHSQVRGSVMYPYYMGYSSSFALKSDDILGMQSIYGKPAVLPPVSVRIPSLIPRSSTPSSSRASTISTTSRSTTRTNTRPVLPTTTTPRYRRCKWFQRWFGWC